MFAANPAAQGPASAEFLAQLRPVRYCVFALWLCFLVKSIFTSPLAQISDLILAISGTYLLMNDEKLSGCYSLILRTPLSFCGSGGLQCAVPFVFMGAISGLFGIFQFFSLLSSGMFTLNVLGFVYTAAVGVSTFSACFGAYSVYVALKPIIAARPAENSFAVHPPQYVSLAPASRVFAGSSNRLGEVASSV